MELKVFRSLWGYPTPLPEAVPGMLAAGYEGIEGVLPPPGSEREALIGAVRAAAVEYIPLVLMEAETPSEQLGEFRGWLEEIAALELPLAVMHTGRDHWSTTEAVSFYREVVAIEAELGVQVAHETHRSRALYAPWSTSAILAEVPELGLCCDFSHWVLVCERVPETQADAFAAAASRCLHLHARQGSDQVPQVPEPGASAEAAFQAAFERWWQMVWDDQEARGVEVATVTPEYGPPPYQQFSGHGGELAEELTVACGWQASRLRRLFAERQP